MQERSVEVSGVETRWLESGSGIPIVLVHGIPTSPELWRHVLPRIGEGRRLALEMVGYGRFAPKAVGRDISVAQQAAHLLAWLDVLSIPRAVLVGHDLGGGVVQIAAARRPDRCSGLVLTNSIAYDSWPIPSVLAMQKAAPLVARLPRAALRGALKSMLYRGHDDRRLFRESLDTHWQSYDRPDGARLFAAQVGSLRTEDTLNVARLLPQIRVPSRVVWGAADRFQKLTYGERLARDLGAELVRIEGGKHFTPEDHPDHIARAINDVVREAKRREGASTSARPRA